MAGAPGSNLWDNPAGTDGFEFVEYAAPDPQAMGRLFEQMGFTAIARHRSKNVLLYRQGTINFIVKAAAKAYAHCVANGAWGVEAHPGPMELSIPAIKGIGDSLIYLVDRYATHDGTGVSIYDIDFVPLPGVDVHPAGAGLTYI